MNLTAQQQQTLLGTARAAIRATLSRQQPPSIDCQDPMLNQPSGCFVTLHDQITHRLRGCIGRLQSSDSLIQAVRDTAVGVLNDPRFVNYPVTLADLPRLEIEISVLSPMHQAGSPVDFDPLVHGIYLIINQRGGCFLPQVARETGWTRQQLLDRLCSEKLGLLPQAWQDPAARLFRFTCEILGPEPFVQAERPNGQ